MKNTKEIDQYFKMDEQPLNELEERRPSVRRVSFALEPQIIYPQAKEEQSKSESSSISMSMEIVHKTSMEMTMDEQIMEDDLMQNETLPLYEDKEENFIMDDSEDTIEERRMSICPIDREKTMEHTFSHISTNVAANIEGPSVISDVTLLKESAAREDGPACQGALPDKLLAQAGEIEDIICGSPVSKNSIVLAPPENISVHSHNDSLAGGFDAVKDVAPIAPCYNNEEYSLDDGKDDILSDMLSEIVCAADNNTLVYDTVNVEEVLSKYEMVKKEETKKIREILAETGIRFLDNLSLSNRRETLSKIRNKVDQVDLIYYKYFVQRRIEMQNVLSSGLSKEIEKTREETEVVEREVDCTGLSSIDRNTLLSKLRQIKSDARKEGKAHWHIKRLEVEKEFLSKTRELYADFEKEKEQLRKKIRAMEKERENINIQELEEKEKAMKDILVTIGTLSQDEVNRFVGEVEQNKKIEDELKAQYTGIVASIREIKESEAENTKIIENEKLEIQSLQDSLQVAEVQKDDLDQIKSTVQRMEVILGVKILEISHSRLLLSICDIVITVIYDGLSVVDVYAETKAKNIFKEFISLSVGSVLVSIGMIVESIPSIVRYILEMTSIEKEVKKLGMSVPYKIHYTEKKMSIQFMIRKGKSGQMGEVVALFETGSSVPEISSNIRGFKVSKNRYGSISESVNFARNIAHIK